MAKSVEDFKKIFADATASIPAESKNSEYIALYKGVMTCIREGESDSGYVQNQCGYNSQTLPTKVVNAKKSTKEKPAYFTRAELFGIVWNKAMADMRHNVANATIAKVWGVSLEGMRGIAGYIVPYCDAIERGIDDVKFIPSKKEVRAIEQMKNSVHEKTSKQGIKTFSLPLSDFLTDVLNKKLPLKDRAISDRHAEFSALYLSKLGKYTAFRTQRLSADIAGIADELEW